MRVWGVALLLPITSALIGCTPEPEPTADDVKALFQDTEEASLARHAAIDDLVVRCMTENGFDYRPPTLETDTIDLAPGLEGRDRLESIGSGTVAFALWSLEDQANAGDEADAPLGDEAPIDELEEEEQWSVLHESVQVGDATIDGGCSKWAQDEYLRLHPEYETQLELDMAYGEYLEPAATDVRMRELDDEWADCMAQQGFGGYHAMGDHFTDIIKRTEAIQFGGDDPATIKRKLEELLPYDIEVSVAAGSCTDQVIERKRDIYSEYAQLFVEDHQDQIAQLDAD